VNNNNTKTRIIEANKKFGEKIRVLLSQFGIFDDDFRIETKKNKIFIPITRELTESESNELREKDPNFNTTFRRLKRVIKKPKTFREYLKDKIDKDLFKNIPKSFDIIGNIAIIEIPETLEKIHQNIGDAIVKTFKNIRTVYSEKTPVSGEYRTQELKLIGGVDNPITTHKENSCLFKLNVKKVYFNPRLGTERLRVVNNVKNDEKIIDMFAGIGPYSIQIAKNKETEVIAFDINPEAIKYFKINLLKNKIETINPILGDVRNYINQYENYADRIIMNLPGSAFNYLKDACKFISDRGGIIHYYQFVKNETKNDQIINTIANEIDLANREVKKILFAKKIKQVSPSKSQIAIDIKIE
jgi:tRNA (guanine37-N1)-methyltransferase